MSDFSILNGYNVKDKYTRDKLSDEIKVNYLSSGEDYVINHNYLGECIVINGNKNIIIDLGFDSQCTYLINFLNSNNITKIDYIFISHYHADHIGGNGATGLVNLLSQNNLDFSECTAYLPHKNINWNRFIGSSVTGLIANETDVKNALDSANIPYVYSDNESIVNIDNNLEIELLNTNIDYSDYYNETTNWNLGDLEATNYNNFSMVIQLKHHNNYFLFPSDIEYLAQSKVYSYIKNCDVYQIEHHGLNYLTYDEYINQINPKYAIIEDIDDLQPNELIRDTLNSLLLKGSTIYSTRTGGNITIISDYNKIKDYNNLVFPITEITSTIYGGDMLPKNTDLNSLVKVGTYHSEGATESATMVHTPHTSSGFKLIVEQLTYKPLTLRQVLITSNDPQPKIFIRNKYDNSWSSWTCLTGSIYGKIPYTAIEKHANISNLNGENCLYFVNNLIVGNVHFTLTGDIAGATNLLVFPKEFTQGNETIEISYGNDTTNFVLVDNTNNTAYSCYCGKLADGTLTLRTRKAITSGTELVGQFTRIR